MPCPQKNACIYFKNHNENCYGCSYQHCYQIFIDQKRKLLNKPKEYKVISDMEGAMWQHGRDPNRSSGAKFDASRPLHEIIKKYYKDSVRIISTDFIPLEINNEQIKMKHDGQFRRTKGGPDIFIEYKGYPELNSVLSALIAAKIIKENGGIIPQPEFYFLCPSYAYLKNKLAMKWLQIGKTLGWIDDVYGLDNLAEFLEKFE